MEVILLRIVVGDIDVAVPKKAVRGEKVIGLVSGERCAPENQDERGDLVNEERRQKHAEGPPAGGERREPEDRSVDGGSALDQEGGEAGGVLKKGVRDGAE